jgi:threonine dehydrogenase-like Zn-dependent dehydrogenase
MRATIMFGAGDVRIENIPDARLIEPTDAVVRVTRACICGSDLWPYRGLEEFPETGRRMGHEAIGVVDVVGADVRTIKRGDLVIMPFAFSDGSCIFCNQGLQTSCIHGGFFGIHGNDGAQAEALRVPPGGRNTVFAADRQRRCADAVAADPFGRDGNRSSCGGLRQGWSWEKSRRRR